MTRGDHHRAGSGSPRKRVLHVFQKVATPHNNDLLRAVHATRKLDLRLYYSARGTSMYDWNTDITDEIVQSAIIGERSVNWRIVWRALTRRREDYLFVSWPNATVRVLLLMFWMTWRPFYYWNDYPVDFWDGGSLAPRYSWTVSTARRFLYHVVRERARRVFLVGGRTVEAFSSRGWSRSRLVNLPVCVSLPQEPSLPAPEQLEVRSAYGVGPADVFLVTGSRLEWAKGFDVLVDACATLRDRGRRRFRVVIVGDGPEREGLGRLVEARGLEQQVTFERWLEPSAFELLIRACDVYVHPARFDAFGGGTLVAMACGKAVVGSDGAGSAVERVVDGENGYLYPSESAVALCDSLERFLDDPSLTGAMGSKARTTALEWPPERSADILLNVMECG